MIGPLTHELLPKRARRVALRYAAGILAAAIARQASAQEAASALVQPGRQRREALMARAFEMRRRAIERGDQPYGAVIAMNGRVVGEGVSAVVTDNDPTAHAEMQAIRDAARRLGTRDLSGCEMYGTSPACSMCEAGAYWARIGTMYHGESVVDAGAPRLR